MPGSAARGMVVIMALIATIASCSHRSHTAPEVETVCLTVRDHGIGVPAERRERIVDRFHRAHADSYRSGLGLGLDVSRAIVELHRGSIHAEFPPDGGTRVVVYLPRDRADIGSE